MLNRYSGSISKLIQSAVGWLVNSPGHAFVFIFILAFGVRAYSWIKIAPLVPNPDRELGAIAWSLAETGHFADPYAVPTGPTAHLPPVYPAILALILSLFGNTWQAGYVFSGFTVMTSAVAYALIPWIAGKLGMGKPAGFIAGVAGALILELETPDHGEGLAGIALGLMLVTFLKRWGNGRSSLFSSLLLGLGIGASFHVQPPILLVFLGYFAFEIGWLKGNRKFAMNGMLALGVVLACVPWVWRNYTVFHEFFFIRSNLGLELRMGNSAGVAATFAEMDRGGANYQHPRLLHAEALKVKELGEAEYMRQALDDAVNWVEENSGEFLKLTFLRFAHFWFIPPSRSPAAVFLAAFTILAILGARRVVPSQSLPQRIALLTPLITYPLIYYFVPFMPRYRAPIDWLVFMLAGVQIWHWISSLKKETSMNTNHNRRIFIILTISILLTSCSARPPQPTAAPVSTDAPQANMANPASVYCEEQGNKLEIHTAADGSQSGMCVFPDGSECDEWAYFRDECGPTGQDKPTAPPTEIPAAMPVDPADYQGFWTYTHPVYNFSIMLPEDWVVEDVTTSDPLMSGHILTLHPRDNSGKESIRLTFRRAGEEYRLWPTGVGQGGFIPQGTLDIAGQPARRILLVCPSGEITAIWYHGAEEDRPNIARGGMEFGFIFSAGSHCEPGYSLDGKIQHTGEMIIASLNVP